MVTGTRLRTSTQVASLRRSKLGVLERSAIVAPTITGELTRSEWEGSGGPLPLFPNFYAVDTNQGPCVYSSSDAGPGDPDTDIFKSEVDLSGASSYADITNTTWTNDRNGATFNFADFEAVANAKLCDPASSPIAGADIVRSGTLVNTLSGFELYGYWAQYTTDMTRLLLWSSNYSAAVGGPFVATVFGPAAPDWIVGDTFTAVKN